MPERVLRIASLSELSAVERSLIEETRYAESVELILYVLGNDMAHETRKCIAPRNNDVTIGDIVEDLGAWSIGVQVRNADGVNIELHSAEAIHTRESRADV